MKKIIVVGAGHGGITAAAYLAEKGYAVEVFEKNEREHLGYDWHDTIENKTFDYAGIKVSKKDYIIRRDSTFFPPSLECQVSIDIPPEHREYSIDRKVLYRYLIDNAIKKGVVFHFGVEVLAPLIIENKIVGITTLEGSEKADFVIDSSGIYSPLIKKLPKDYNIQNDYGEKDVFWAYRAYFNLEPNAKIINFDRFNFYLMFEGIKGLTWFKENEGLADILIGSIEPLDSAEFDFVLERLRQAQPSIGYELKRGGYAGDIPLKSTLPLIVGDNYALIGDSASMPVPMNGSGITNAIFAGKLLAETLIKADNQNLDWLKANIWEYQVEYFTKIGSKMISVYVLKNFLLGCTKKQVNFLFHKGILGSKELGNGAIGQEIVLDKKAIIDKLKKGWRRPILLLKMKCAVEKSKKANQAVLAIPKKYQPQAVQKWIDTINAYIR